MTKRKLQKLLEELMYQNGFKSIGGRFVRIENDIAFGVSLDAPGGLVYCTAFVIPLYIPTDVLNYTYGNRIEKISGNTIHPLCRGADLPEVEDWVQKIRKVLQSTIFPFFDSVSTPEKLLSFIQYHAAETRRFFFCPIFHIDRLQIYTQLYLHDRTKVNEKIYHMQESVLSMNCYTEKVQNQMLDELNQIMLLSSKDISEIDLFFHSTIVRTISNCFPG